MVAFFTEYFNIEKLNIFVIFAGDLQDEQRVLDWLTSQDVFEIKDEIEEVNRKMLDKLLDENEFVSVYFCKSTLHNPHAL